MRGAVILGGEKPNLQIYVPKGYETGDVRIVGRCHICEAEFGEGEENAWQKHVGDCYRRHEAEVRASAPSERNGGGPWDSNNWDPEWEQAQLATGRRMLAEGRWERKPNEC